MGFLDKAKSTATNVAGKAKEGAQTLATEVKDEAKEKKLAHDLNKAFTEYGKKAFELHESGAIAHAELDELAARIKELREQHATVAD